MEKRCQFCEYYRKAESYGMAEIGSVEFEEPRFPTFGELVAYQRKNGIGMLCKNSRSSVAYQGRYPSDTCEKWTKMIS